VTFDKMSLNPIEYFGWECLTVGALGWGQIQIANSNIVCIKENSRKEWILKLCEKLETFYPKEIKKIQKRIYRFSKVKQYWQNK